MNWIDKTIKPERDPAKIDRKLLGMVKKDDMASEIIQHADSVVTAISKTDGVGKVKTTKVTVDENGLTIDDGALMVRDKNNQAIMTSNGLRMKYVFVSDGPLFGWQRAGIAEDIDGIQSRINYLFFYVPNEFIIESAILHTRSLPYYLTEQSGITNAPDGYYHARGLRLNRIDDYSDMYFVAFGYSLATEPVVGEHTDITTSTWGSTWNPSGSRIKTISTDISKHINVGGQNVFFIKSNLSGTTNNMRYQSALKMELEISGFLRG